jgi:hypothetical protein
VSFHPTLSAACALDLTTSPGLTHCSTEVELEDPAVGKVSCEQAYACALDGVAAGGILNTFRLRKELGLGWKCDA